MGSGSAPDLAEAGFDGEAGEHLVEIVSQASDGLVVEVLPVAAKQ
jgi:hypothetical protein